MINQAFIDSGAMQRASWEVFDATLAKQSVSLWLLFPALTHLFIAASKAWLLINNTSITVRYHLTYPMGRYLNSRKLHKLYSSVRLKGNCLVFLQTGKWRLWMWIRAALCSVLYRITNFGRTLFDPCDKTWLGSLYYSLVYGWYIILSTAGPGF